MVPSVVISKLHNPKGRVSKSLYFKIHQADQIRRSSSKVNYKRQVKFEKEKVGPKANFENLNKV